jgi:hypothetical protein
MLLVIIDKYFAYSLRPKLTGAAIYYVQYKFTPELHQLICARGSIFHFKMFKIYEVASIARNIKHGTLS